MAAVGGEAGDLVVRSQSLGADNFGRERAFEIADFYVNAILGRLDNLSGRSVFQLQFRPRLQHFDVHHLNLGKTMCEDNATTQHATRSSGAFSSATSAQPEPGSTTEIVRPG